MMASRNATPLGNKGNVPEMKWQHVGTLFLGAKMYYPSASSRAMRFICWQSEAVSGRRSLECSQAESINRRPSAQASNCSPLGLDNGVKPLRTITTTGRCWLKAWRMTSFSPGDMAGDMSTAPLCAASMYRAASACNCWPVMRRDMRTAMRHGTESNARLPMPL